MPSVRSSLSPPQSFLPIDHRHLQQIEQSIDLYLAAMDSAVRATPEVA